MRCKQCNRTGYLTEGIGICQSCRYENHISRSRKPTTPNDWQDGDAPTMPMRGPGHCPTEDEITRAADTQGGAST